MRAKVRERGIRKATSTRTPMQHAIELARIAQGTTSPNPPVGAVLVNHGRIVGEGLTQPPGGPHAEIVALRTAGTSARGATLFVTLEPCTHWGRTPPCADALVEAGITAAHVAALDPNPVVHERGIERLRQAGIDVTVGELADEAGELLEAHATYIVEGRPLVTLLHEVSPAARQEVEATADLILESSESGRICVKDLLRELARREITSVVVPVTDPLSEALLDAGLVDRIVTGIDDRPRPGFTLKKQRVHPAGYTIYTPARPDGDAPTSVAGLVD